ncbi:MAG: GNAT family N-acetyltransferase [Acidobacteriota bacterium]|nr:GNAT family N-acetyltransferase [Acidobacteriota bacterium]
MKIEPVTLDGNFVRLEPLRVDHLDELYEVGANGTLWLWTQTIVKNKDDMRRYITNALEEFERKVSLPFVTIEKSSRKIIGSTRFGNIDVRNRRAEIGWTWINQQWQRTRINTEAKLLMLTHAFENWKCIRVELKTDALNEKSRNAIKRIGAREEGILRQHAITDSGRIRDTVYYSILDSEWHNVKNNLEKKLHAS